MHPEAIDAHHKLRLYLPHTTHKLEIVEYVG